MKTIAVLFHEFAPNPTGYVVHQLAGFWREAGHTVKYVFGTRKFEPADLVLVHVDLSVVPKSYLEFATRYPVALNARLGDIRKSRISTLLVKQHDDWEGPVIVKSDLNFGGGPEKRLGRTWLEQRFSLVRRLRLAIERRLPGNTPFAESSKYRVFESSLDVPEAWFKARNVVVERFMPEMDGGRYHLRICQALGDRFLCTRLSSDQPVIKAGNSLSATEVEPHPQVAQWRQELGLDYGKLDYVEIDGEPILLDVNKTIGATLAYMDPESLEQRRRYLAEGIYTFLR
jgi:hypothetical protein